MIKLTSGSSKKRLILVVIAVSLLIVGVTVAVWFRVNNSDGPTGSPQGAPEVNRQEPTVESANKQYEKLSDNPPNDSANNQEKEDYYGELGEAAIVINNCQAASQAADNLYSYNQTRAVNIYFLGVTCYRTANDEANAKQLLDQIEQKANSITEPETRQSIIEQVNMERSV